MPRLRGLFSEIGSFFPPRSPPGVVAVIDDAFLFPHIMHKRESSRGGVYGIAGEKNIGLCRK